MRETFQMDIINYDRLDSTLLIDQVKKSLSGDSSDELARFICPFLGRTFQGKRLPQNEAGDDDSYTEEDINNTAPIGQPQNAVQQSLPGVHSGLNLSTPSPVASGLYSTPIMPSICRGHKTTGASIPGNSSPHRMQSPLFPGSIVHNAPQTPALLTTPMTLSHYGSGLRAMTAFGGISSAPPNLAANLRRHHCKLCPAVSCFFFLLTHCFLCTHGCRWVASGFVGLKWRAFGFKFGPQASA
ncbi:hypothetical protein D918_01956 [Trichuris suis]|nr:hypothetical protein D918_01956 [Trichuris suis]